MISNRYAKRHSFLNLLQSAALIALMAVMTCISVTAIAGFELALLISIGVVIGLFVAPNLPRTVLLSSYHAERLTPRTAPDMVAALSELAHRAGLKSVPELYRVPSRIPNAFAMGSAEQSAICVKDGLLGLLNGRELLGVLAHEVGHIANHDLWIMSLADVMTRVVSTASWVGQFLLLLNLPLVLAGMVDATGHASRTSLVMAIARKRTGLASRYPLPAFRRFRGHIAAKIEYSAHMAPLPKCQNGVVCRHRLSGSRNRSTRVDHRVHLPAASREFWPDPGHLFRVRIGNGIATATLA